MKKSSEHGLGNYLPPKDPENRDPIMDWIAIAWKSILAGHDIGPRVELPIWGAQLALTRLAISTPGMMDWFHLFNSEITEKRQSYSAHYSKSVKPFNRFDHVSLDLFMSASEKLENLQKICLISPVSSKNPEHRRWVNIHEPSGGFHHVVARKNNLPDTSTQIGLTYSDLIHRHSGTRETKFLSPVGADLRKDTSGLLRRNRIHVLYIIHIGKEANDFELVQAGLVEEEDEILTTFERDPWEILKPIVAQIHYEEIMEATGYSRSMVFGLKSGERCPKLPSQQFSALARIGGNYARGKLINVGFEYTPKSEWEAIRYLMYLMRII